MFEFGARYQVRIDAVKDAKRANIQAHIEVNVYSVISLYPPTWDLLQKASREPIFMPISSTSSLLEVTHTFLSHF